MCLSLGFNLSLRLTLFSNQLGHVSDDFGLILTNSRLPQGGAFWSRLLADEPLFLLFDAVRVAVLGTNPWPHHLFLGLLLSVNAALAFALVWRLSGSALFATSFLVLLVTLPGHSEAEYWISSPYAWLRLWLLASGHLTVSWLQNGGRWRYAGLWLCYAVAVFTHEAALGFAAVLFVLWLLWARTRSLGRATRMLGPLVLTNLAYLALRQTQWFGWGYAGLAAERKIQLASVGINLKVVISQTFGADFLGTTADLIRVASSEGASLIPATAVLVAALWAVTRVEAPRRQTGWLGRGMLLTLILVGASGLYAAAPAFPQPFGTLHTLLRGATIVFLVSIAWHWFRGRSQPGSGSAIPRLMALGAAWFLFAVAANLLWYVASRHYYIPSVGVALLLAGVLYWPAQVAPAGRRRDLLTGAALLATALIGGCFHLARLGEAHHWVQASRYTRSLEAQLRSQLEGIPHHATLVVLDLPDMLGPAPLLPPWGLRDAARCWFRDPGLAAGAALMPATGHFRIDPPTYPAEAHYENLLLFTFRGEVLERVGELVLERPREPPLTVRLADGNGLRLHVKEGAWISRSGVRSESRPPEVRRAAADLEP